MIPFLTSPIGKWLGIITAVLLFLGTFGASQQKRGRDKERQKAEAKQLKDEKDTADRIDNVEITDNDVAIRWLRKRQRIRDL